MTNPLIWAVVSTVVGRLFATTADGRAFRLGVTTLGDPCWKKKTQLSPPSTHLAHTCQTKQTMSWRSTVTENYRQGAYFFLAPRRMYSFLRFDIAHSSHVVFASAGMKTKASHRRDSSRGPSWFFGAQTSESTGWKDRSGGDAWGALGTEHNPR